MPPLLPISDLSWIAIFQEFTPTDQMKASKMNPRFVVLVRAANRNVKSLVITDQNVEDPSNLKNLKDQINSFFLASEPAMQQLMDIPDKPSFLDYPMTTARLSKWHCLMIDSIKPIDTVTTEQIVNIFSAVTDLKFIIYFEKYSEPLLFLLQHPKWQCQLTDFMVEGSGWMYRQEGRELIAAINGLTALKCLALFWHSDIDIPDLTILAQLKVVALKTCPNMLLAKPNLKTFVRSLERHAADNADLQVHLLSDITDSLLSLSQPLHSRILRYGMGYLDYTSERVALLCSRFRSLTSLSISNITVTVVVPLFTALSQLHQLVHLSLWANLWSRKQLPWARPLAQLNTVRALELFLNITSHYQLKWLNLPVTMPNLQTIFIEYFCCFCCGVQIGRYTDEDLSLLKSSRAVHCLQSSLFTLHSGVPLNRLILKFKEECISAEKLLLHSASEPSTEQR